MVVDTHVLVAGLLNARFRFAISDALLREYEAVLLRPHLVRLHGLTAAEVESVMAGIARNAIRLVPVAGSPAPDPGDQHLWGLLASRSDLHLVTGDRRLLEDAGMAGRVISPMAFVQGL